METITQPRTPVIRGAAIFYGIAVLLVSVPVIVLWVSNGMNRIDDMMLMIYPGCIIGIATGFVQAWRSGEEGRGIPHILAIILFVALLMFFGIS